MSEREVEVQDPFQEAQRLIKQASLLAEARPTAAMVDATSAVAWALVGIGVLLAADLTGKVPT